jgi:CheY-specific phosphatase CheX
MYDLTGLLEQAAEEVLENMFFSGVLSELDTPACGHRLCAMVVFTGSSNGELRVSAPLSTAAVLAAGFLGAEEDEVPDSQVRAIVGELANVLCGVVLGRMSPSGNFAISAPEVTDGDDGGAVGTLDFRRRFELMEGDLSVGLTVH